MRGAEAKEAVKQKIIDTFGQNYLGEQDKKLYIRSQENNEEVIVAISMTCPKNFSVSSGEGGIDFASATASGTPTDFKPAEITIEETANIQKMLAELGL